MAGLRLGDIARLRRSLRKPRTAIESHEAPGRVLRARTYESRGILEPSAGVRRIALVGIELVEVRIHDDTRVQP